MSPAERAQRYCATSLRAASEHYRRGSEEHALAADLLALEGLDLSDLYRPGPGDALALRGEG